MAAIDIEKPVLKDLDAWASKADPEVDIVVPYQKIAEGWWFADKPTYQYLNWFWKTNSEFLIHVNQRGIPEWNNTTVYNSSAYVIHEDHLYQSFSESIGSFLEPSYDSRFWAPDEYMRGLKDTTIDTNENEDLLVLMDSDVFVTRNAEDVVDMILDDLEDVADLHEVDKALTFNGLTWEQGDIYTLFKEKVNIGDLADVVLDNPSNEQILVRDDYSLGKDEYGNDILTHGWVNKNIEEYAYASWRDVLEKPVTFQPIPASSTDFGGIKIEVIEENGNNYLYISNT
jgi:hypothetical protein